jgi:FixJ family two-component response regulator
VALPPIMVYIVDDDPAIQQALERLMRSAGLRA